MLDFWLAWFCTGLVQIIEATRSSQMQCLCHVQKTISQPFSLISGSENLPIPSLTMLPEQHGVCVGGYSCLLKSEQTIVLHSLDSDQLWIFVLTAVCCNRSFSDEGWGLLLIYRLKVLGRQFDTKINTVSSFFWGLKLLN